MREIIDAAPMTFVNTMRRQVLSDGTALLHLRSSLFSTIPEVRSQSRFMLSLWMDGHPTAMSLLRRTIPHALVDLVDVRIKDDEATKEGAAGATGVEKRWSSLFVALGNDHETPTLVRKSKATQEQFSCNYHCAL